MSKTYFNILLALGIIMFFPATNSLADEQVLICGEPAAPFIYETEDEDGIKKIVGIHPENFALIEKLTGLAFKFEILPWKRCLFYVDNYDKSGDYEIAIDASFSQGRAENYHFVGPLYSLSNAVYYSKNKFPNGLVSSDTGEVVSKFDQMRSFKMCELLGWGFGADKSENPFPTSGFEQTPAGFQAAFNMLSRERCDILLNHPTLASGAITAGELDMPQDIVCNKLQEQPKKFYLMVAKKSPRAHELVTKLSTAIIYLKNKGEWKTYTDPGVLPTSEDTKDFLQCM